MNSPPPPHHPPHCDYLYYLHMISYIIMIDTSNHTPLSPTPRAGHVEKGTAETGTPGVTRIPGCVNMDNYEVKQKKKPQNPLCWLHIWHMRVDSNKTNNAQTSRFHSIASHHSNKTNKAQTSCFGSIASHHSNKQTKPRPVASTASRALSLSVCKIEIPNLAQHPPHHFGRSRL